MRRPRFHLRTLLVAVAALGLILGLGVALKRRSDRYRALAAYHAEQALIESVTGPEETGFAQLWTDKGMFHKELQQRYEHAIRRPWISLPLEPIGPPDPPRPSPVDPGRPVLP